MTHTVTCISNAAWQYRILFGRVGLTVASLLIVAAFGTVSNNRVASAAALTTDNELTARGAYLVAIADCNGCHTPFKPGPNGFGPDPSRLLSGHPETLQMPPPPSLSHGPWAWVGAGTNTAFAGPWGISYAANLTPDKDTGIGSWNETMFISAIKTGKHLGAGRPILPPMPWPAYSQMTNDDLRAVFAYLQTIPPIANRVPNPVPGIAAKP